MRKEKIPSFKTVRKMLADRGFVFGMRIIISLFVLLMIATIPGYIAHVVGIDEKTGTYTSIILLIIYSLNIQEEIHGPLEKPYR